MKDNKIFLVGFMGCGKSTYGRKLAQKLNWNFIDMDDCIEEKENMSISEIFETKGEEYFRNVETETLKDFENSNSTIISCGGGVPCFNNNMSIINSIGESVYISLPPTTLKERLVGEKSKRPLVAKLSDEELLSFISSKLEERGPFYEQAKFIFEYEKESEEAFFDRLFK